MGKRLTPKLSKAPAVRNASAALTQKQERAALGRQIKTIRKLWEAHQNAFRTTLKTALDLGDALQRAKDMVGHGGWMEFCSKLPLSHRTISDYMALARHRAKLADIANMTMLGAWQVIREFEGELLPADLPDGIAMQMEAEKATPPRLLNIHVQTPPATPQTFVLDVVSEDRTPRPVLMLSHSAADKAAQAAAAAAPTPPTQYPPPPEQPRKKPAEPSAILERVTDAIERTLEDLEDLDIKRLVKQADVARPWADKFAAEIVLLTNFATQLTEALKPRKH
jgi:hypothetical protein